MSQRRDGQSWGPRMHFTKAMLAAAFMFAAAALAPPAHAEALDDIMEAKVIKIAVPQDFAPFGSAGPDLKPQGYDIDMANLIAKELGVKVEIIAGHQRQPHSLPADQEGRPRHLQPRQEPRAREGDRLLRRLCAVLLRRVRHQGRSRSASADDLAGKTIGATRGAIEEQELTKIAPSDDHHQALRGQQRHHRRLRLRPGRPDRHRQHGRRRHRREERRRGRRR